MEKRARILAVDDEELNRFLIRDILAHERYDVTLACDGVEALAKVEATSPDVILLDVQMPRMDGLEVLKHLKEDGVTRLIPVIMVTGLSDVEHKIQALEAGADDFLSKPVNIAELIARVRSLVKVKAYHDHMRDYQRELEAEVSKRTQQLQRAFEQIKLASLDTIYRLSRAAEYKDEDTAAHLQRMSRYSAAIARKIQLPEKTIEAILYAAPMHDVGKIGIPDRILLKPAKLDPGEWEIMKQHTTIGAKILSGSSQGFIKLAEVIARTHHEKWDGTGYPYQLKGTAIPQAGRIVAVADVFDALISRRPYKEPFALDVSFAIIEEGRGAHFDPRLVDAFLSIQDEIIAIRDKFRDED